MEPKDPCMPGKHSAGLSYISSFMPNLDVMMYSDMMRKLERPNAGTVGMKAS